MSHTKKVGSAGRFGPRYGGLARRTITNVEKVQRAAHPCKRCGQITVYRQGTAMWVCKKCDYTFTGGAYAPQTGAGAGAEKALRAVQDKLANPASAAESEA